MEQNNIENQIREKLNSREIQPSSQAWDRLDAMLSIAEEKKTKRSFGWLYMAASILVFVSVGMFFYNQSGTKINTSETVVSNDDVKDTVKQNAVADKEMEIAIPNTEEKSADKIINNSIIVPTNQKTNSNPIINKEKEIEFQNSSDVALKNLPKIMASDKEIVIPKSTTDNQNTVATIQEKKPDNTSKVKINANSLLSQVDGELNLTFREKVFKKVNKNYKEVKVAIANRNNQ